MPEDKQLRSVTLAGVLERRQLSQALNAKQFAVLVGVSYSTARRWFRLPGFPAIQGFVFWEDFVEWRRNRIAQAKEDRSTGVPSSQQKPSTKASIAWSSRASRILAEVRR
jgi:hypothetical protein